MTDIQEIYAVLLAKEYQDDLFQELQDPKRAGRETEAVCPFCGESDSRSRHFSYSSEKPLWRCWHCDEAGDWLQYMEKKQGLQFMAALQVLAKAAGRELTGTDPAKYKAYTRRADILEAAQELFIKSLQAPRGKAVLEYLLARGYTDHDIQKMEIGAYVDRAGLQHELLSKGYTDQELKDSGLLTGDFGETHQLALLWRDPAGRAIGLATRSLLSGQALKERGLSKYKYSYGLQKDQGLIGLTTARGAKEILLLEGVLDALYLSSRGIKTVAIGGTSLASAQIKALQDNGTQELLLCLDADEAGQAATEKAIQQLRASKLRAYIVSLPEGVKDPDELVRLHGLEALQDAMAMAQRASTWMAGRILSQHDLHAPRGLDKAIQEAMDVYADLDNAIERRAFLEAVGEPLGLSAEDLAPIVADAAQKASVKRDRGLLDGTLRKAGLLASDGDIAGAEQELTQGLQALKSSRGAVAPEPYLLEHLEKDISTMTDGLSTGYESLDKLFRIPVGALTIVAGRPGHGKTTLQLNMLLNMARKYQDKAFYFFTYEEGARGLALNLIMMMAGKVFKDKENFNQRAYINYFKERRGTDQAIEKAILEYQKLSSSGRIWIIDKRHSAEDLASTIGLLAKRREVGAVFVDYIQKISLQRPMQGQRYLEVKRVLELLLDQAVKEDIPICLGAQLGRTEDKTAKARVRLDNLREAGDIEQDANLVLGLYNESVEKAEEGEPVKSKTAIQVTVLKNRQGKTSRDGALLSFQGPTLRLTDGD